LDSSKQAQTKFYADLFGNGDVTSAWKKNFLGTMQMFNAEEAFAKAARGYIHSHTKGKAAQQRRERLLTTAIDESPRALTRNDRRRMRQVLKQGIKLTQARLDEYAATFLIGKPTQYRLEDLAASPDPN
jgi:hypothetical protein